MIGDDTVAIGTSVRYGYYVHEGINRRVAKPFLTWGIENGSQRIQDELDRAIEQVVTP